MSNPSFSALDTSILLFSFNGENQWQVLGTFLVVLSRALGAAGARYRHALATFIGRTQ